MEICNRMAWAFISPEPGPIPSHCEFSSTKAASAPLNGRIGINRVCSKLLPGQHCPREVIADLPAIKSKNARIATSRGAVKAFSHLQVFPKPLFGEPGPPEAGRIMVVHAEIDRSAVVRCRCLTLVDF